jgi:WD40 repeat protein
MGAGFVQFTPDGKFLVSSGPSGANLSCWDTSSGKLARSIDSDHNPWSIFAFLPDGKRLASVGCNGEGAFVYDWVTGKKLTTLRGPGEHPTAIAVSPDSNHVACGCRWGGLHVWNLVNGQQRSWVPDKPAGDITGLVFSADSKRLVIVQEGEVAKTVESATGRQLRQFDIGEHAVVALDGKWVVGKRLFIWEPENGASRRLRAKDGEPVWWFSASPDGRQLLAADGRSDTLYIFDPRSGEEVRRLTLDGLRRGLWRNRQGVVVSPDGKQLATSDGNACAARLWNCQTGQALFTVPGHSKPPADLAFSSDGKEIISVAFQDGVFRWNLATLRPAVIENRHEQRRIVGAHGLEERTRGGLHLDPDDPTNPLSQDGRFVVRYDKNRAPWKALGIWEVASGKRVYRLDGSYSAARFSPTDNLLATGCTDDCSILLWDVRRLLANEARRVPDWDQLLAEPSTAIPCAMKLSLDEEAAITLLRDHLRPIAHPDKQKVARLIATLDDPVFAERERASRELADFGEAIESSLRAASTDNSSLETRRRVRQLVERLVRSSPDHLREVRSVQVLEYLGTPAARRVLRAVASGAPDAVLTCEAKAALGRLERRRVLK